MIALPFNDHECLYAISQAVAEAAEADDPVIAELAARYPTERALVEYFRSLPQRDDLGDPDDGPRIYACDPSQRLQLDSQSPNCVERAASFISVRQRSAPEATFQLATVDTPHGLHTFPLVNGRPVILDPRVTKDCVDCGLALATPGPIAVEPRNALAWTTDMASAGAAEFRNGTGPSMVHVARNAIRRLVDRGAVPAEAEVDAMGVLFALAERVARRYGTRALAIVQTTARAIADLLQAVLDRRNVRFSIGGHSYETPEWLDESATALGRVGLDLGSLYLRTKLGAAGVAPEVIGLMESRLNEEGRTLGAFAHPPDLATFARFAASRIG
jgi:hypothetical protein